MHLHTEKAKQKHKFLCYNALNSAQSAETIKRNLWKIFRNTQCSPTVQTYSVNPQYI